jgi:hypothetical protein
MAPTLAELAKEHELGTLFLRIGGKGGGIPSETELLCQDSTHSVL